MAAELHDEEIPKKPKALQGLMLDPMSLSELNDYIVWLENEIKRVQEAMEKKRGAEAAAESFFKKPGDAAS